MKKKIYMIHGWDGSPEDNWFPWLKKELENRKSNVEVHVLDMPNSKAPKIDEWVKYLEENVKDIDEHTYFIGHSIGCQTIMRFIEKLHKHARVGGCLFVAGFFNLPHLETDKERKIAEPWMTTHIEFSRILDHCNNFLAMFSKDDPDVPVSDSEIFKEKLGAKIVITDGRGHFEEKIQPLVLDEALKFIK